MAASRDEDRSRLPRIRLFVYGTFLAGELNHHRLRKSPLVGTASTAPTFDLVSLRNHPALVAGGATSVRGEIYEVDGATCARLDRFEGHPVLFRRTAIELADGHRAEAYLFPRERAEGYPRIASGDWRARPK